MLTVTDWPISGSLVDYVSIRFNGVKLEMVESYNFPGINITNVLPLTNHINATAKKAYQKARFPEETEKF